MKSSQIFYKIKQDKYYLLNTYLFDMITMLLCILVIAKFDMRLNVELNGWKTIACLIIAIANGMVIASLLHNTSHDNISNSWLNRLVGEYCGYWVLYGFSNFILVHLLHHQYTDEELDPVNPSGMTFLTFWSAPMRYMIKTAKKFLLLNFKDQAGYNKILSMATLLFHVNILLRLTIWYLALGKILFLSFYLPGFLSIVSIFAHINYACHRNKEDGSVEIVNLDNNSYYKIANFFTMGGYFHKNHHLNMKIFNPKKLNTERSRTQLFSIPQNAYFKSDKNVTYQGTALSKYFQINDIWGEGVKNRIPQKEKLKQFKNVKI